MSIFHDRVKKDVDCKTKTLILFPMTPPMTVTPPYSDTLVL